ncbi:hypothetical protein BgiMline_034132, partial [Biomphalaria glabrata]
ESAKYNTFIRIALFFFLLSVIAFIIRSFTPRKCFRTEDNDEDDDDDDDY